MNAPMTADPGRRRLIAAAALRVHPSSDIDATDEAVLACRVDASAIAIAANTHGDAPVSARQRAAALALALDILITARRHGVTRRDLDGVMTLAARRSTRYEDLPGLPAGPLAGMGQDEEAAMFDRKAEVDQPAPG